MASPCDTNPIKTPKEALAYILENKSSIIKILKSVQKARDAKSQCKKYVLCVKEPFDIELQEPGEMLLVPGEQILRMYDSCILDCEEFLFVFEVLKNSSFFLKIFKSIEKARKAYNECKEFCACIKIPDDLEIFECVEPKVINICKDIFSCTC